VVWCLPKIPDLFTILTLVFNRSFLGQCPLTILTLCLVAYRLHIPSQESSAKESQFSKLRRIDFLGAILFPVSLVCGLLVLELIGQRMPWNDPTILVLLGMESFDLRILQMMMLVPIYFQVSANASVANAGAHLMPSVIGNAVGGILSGIFIKRYVNLSPGLDGPCSLLPVLNHLPEPDATDYCRYLAQSHRSPPTFS
jgi:hypothetical protein